MTDRTDATTFDPNDPLMIVEALLDGEPVAARDLRAALADPAVREHFVDVLVLRAAVGLAGATAPYAGSGAKPGGRLRWLVAAAALVFSVSAGYLAGQHAAPVPAVATVEAVVLPPEAPVAPPPTRIIPLTPGVNWIDRQEGR